METLRRQVYEEYRPAFLEVESILSANNLHRPELESLGTAHATNRFLNWVRLTEAIGEDTWKEAPLRSPGERRAEVIRLGDAWMKAEDSRVGAEYVSALDNVVRVFQSEQSIESATKDDLSQGLRGLHAFLEQLRFVKGGRANLTEAFWQANNDDQARVKKTVTYLLHGPGDFIQRLHDILYDRDWKIGLFAFFCAFELFGSIKPQEFPPINGRIAKGLRFIGFNVRGT